MTKVSGGGERKVSKHGPDRNLTSDLGSIPNTILGTVFMCSKYISKSIPNTLSGIFSCIKLIFNYSMLLSLVKYYVGHMWASANIVPGRER